MVCCRRFSRLIGYLHSETGAQSCDLSVQPQWNDSIWDTRASLQYGNFSGLIDHSNAANPVKDWDHVYIPLWSAQPCLPLLAARSAAHVVNC